MKKGKSIALWAVCAAAFLILAAAVLQVKSVPLEAGGSTVVYVLPFGRPGGSASADLAEVQAGRYGQEGEAAEQPARTWQGEAAVIRDTPTYEIQYLGRDLSGGLYLRCPVTTVRTVTAPDGGEELASAARICTYTGYDDGKAGSRERAQILWGTLEEAYPSGKAYFDGEPETGS